MTILLLFPHDRLNNGDLPPAAAAALGVAGGVSQTDVDNRFFFGLNQPNVAHQTCRAPGGGSGSCRHLHHCVQPAFFNFFTFISHMCVIQVILSDEASQINIPASREDISVSAVLRR